MATVVRPVAGVPRLDQLQGDILRKSSLAFMQSLGVIGRLALCCCLGALFPTPALAEDWPMGRGNAAGTGATSGTLSDNLELLWEVELGGLGFDAGPIIAADKVFVADAEGRIFALNLSDGSEVWKRQWETGFLASPSYDQEILYAGDYSGKLRALDATSGEEKWTFDAEMEIDASPNFYGDAVLFTSQNGNLYAVDRETGKELWHYETGDQLQCGATLAGSRTFLGGCDSKLHVVDVERGTSLGEPMPLDAPTGSTPSVLGDTVFVPTYAGEIFAFSSKDNTSEENVLKWRFTDEKMSREFKNSIAVGDGLVVAASRNRLVFALNTETGKVAWQHNLRKRADSSPVIAGDRVVIAASDGRVLLLDLANGEQQWMFEVKGGFLGSPAVAAGRLVVASDRGTVYCFGTQP